MDQLDCLFSLIVEHRVISNSSFSSTRAYLLVAGIEGCCHTQSLINLTESKTIELSLYKQVLAFLEWGVKYFSFCGLTF